VPGWTDANAQDPGITVLWALAWTVGGLLAAGVVWRLVRRRDA